MSILRYFDRLDLINQFEVICEQSQDIEVKEWADSLGVRVTRDPADQSEALEVVDTMLWDELEEAKRTTHPSPRLEAVASAYFQFEYRAFYQGFETVEDLEDYNEGLFNCLSNTESKNFEPLADKYKIRVRYWGLVEEELFKSFKGHKLEFIDKFKIIVNFCENYEGQSLEDYGGELLEELKPEGIYNGFFECETLGDLLQAFADWYNWLLATDEHGEWMEGNKTANDFIDCINWRGL
jgi:hypothetical protein